MRLSEILGRVVKPKLSDKFGEIYLRVPEFDDSEEVDNVDIALDKKLPELTIDGLALVLEYEDSAGKASTRLVTCKQLSVEADKHYIRVYCHHRAAIRTFRLDRIKEIFDPQTGECLSPVQAFFAQFAPDKISQSQPGWGLSASRRSDLIALLNALVFLARCDREFHPAERQCLENALTTFWLRMEVAGNPDFDDILNYADKLAPDGEIFWVAMHRMRESSHLAGIFRRQAAIMAEADGVVKDVEAFWLLEIDEFFEAD